MANKLIYREAIEVFRWENNWIQLCVSDWRIVRKLEKMGVARQLSDTRASWSMSAQKAWAAKIVGYREGESAMIEMATTVSEIDEIMSILSPPWCDSLRYKVTVWAERIFPQGAADSLTQKIVGQFHHLKFASAQLPNGNPAPVEFTVTWSSRPSIVGGKKAVERVVGKFTIDRVADNDNMIRALRKRPGPFTRDRNGAIDWAAEKRDMAQWSLLFMRLCSQGSHPRMRFLELVPVWAETRSFANLKMAIIYLAHGDLDSALEMELTGRELWPSLTQWYYGMALRVVTFLDSTLFNFRTVDLILRVGECLSLLDDGGPWKFLSYWGAEVWEEEVQVFREFNDIVEGSSPDIPLDQLASKINEVLERQKQARLGGQTETARIGQRALEHAFSEHAGRNPAYAVCERRGIPQLRVHR